MPSPADAEQVARVVADIYANAECRLLEIIAKRLAAGKDSPRWAEDRLADVRRVRRELAAVVSGLGRSVPPEVQRVLHEAAKAGAASAQAELVAAGATITHTASGVGSVTALARATSVGLLKTHLQILRQATDAYRDAVDVGAIVSSEVGEALAGSGATRLGASQRVLDRLAASGIRSFKDSAGRVWQLDTYAEMAVRTASAQATIQAAADKYAAHGHDLVIVSDSPEECGLCRPWEGRVLSLTGTTNGKPTLAEAKDAGLFHGNCTHRINLYTEGLTVPPTATENPDGYAERQQQRYLERGLREWKRHEAAAVTPLAKAKATAKRKEWNKRLDDHTKKTGRLRQRSREQVKRAATQGAT